MDQERFQALVVRLQDYSLHHPTAYKLRVGLLAAAGYAYLFSVVLLLLLLVGVVLAYVRISSGAGA